MMADQAKKVTIGGKDWKNPVSPSPEAVDEGRGHFQHHCQICHGNDGHNTGVPFADKMSPPVADLGDKDVQQYSDGQLKWIVENGIKLTGMPGWKGVLEDDEMWKIVHFIRHLPAKGSAGVPEVFKEEEMEHKEMHEKGAAHTHTPSEAPEHKH
jgi:S-disulfanyl-L-cysteine oxidoreductase SoxD